MEVIETLGRYEIKRPLGRGASGTVYEGWDPVIARRVAIKTVKLPELADTETEEELARFRRGAQAAGRLEHPNIVGVFDFGGTSELAYIVMEFVDGPTLKAQLDKQERFALADTMRIMEELLAGLQFSHERGVVHRDIKPANVMLTSGGQLKIADFGIARIESSSMTQAGALLGTPAYMSPEQFMGQVVDARTDIYSSGVVLYQLLTGERPFDGGLSAIMHKALNTEPPVPSQLSVTAPPALDDVVRRAMAKRPEDRFPSAKAFAAALRLAFANQPSEGETTIFETRPGQPDNGATVSRYVPPTPPRPPPRPSTMPLIAAAAVVALGAVGGGAWWFWPNTQVPIRPALQPPPARVEVVPAQQPPARVEVPPPQPPPAHVEVPPPRPPPARVEVPPPQTPPTRVEVPPPQQPPARVEVPPPQQPPARVEVPPPQQPPARVEVPPPQQPPARMEVAPPQQPPPARVEVPPAPLPADVLDTLRRQIATWVSSRSCAVLTGNLSGAGLVTLNGLSGNRSVEDLRRGLTSLVTPGQIDWHVDTVDPVFCPALNALHPLTPAFGEAGGPRLALQMAGGKTSLRDREPIRVGLTMPSFTSRLRVDYIVHDGTVQHLYPQLADPKNGIVADALRTYAPGEAVNLGNPSWTSGEPYGTDMIIAVASSEALFDRPRASNAERADVYLRDLQSAIDKLRQRGAHLAGAAVTVETLPK